VDRFFEGALTAPIANLLIVAGFIFLGIAAIGKISGKIEPDTTGRLVAGVIGLCVLGLGLGIYLFPDNFGASRRLQPTEALQSNTPPALATSVPVFSATTPIVLAPPSTTEAEQPTVPAASVPMIAPTPCPVPATPIPTLALAPEVTDLPFFMLREVTKEDLQAKSCYALDLMRNEIYARYGSKFIRTDFQDYFLQQSWYRPAIDRDDSFEATYFTDMQKNNVEIIKYYQCDMGCSDVHCEGASLIYDRWRQR